MTKVCNRELFADHCRFPYFLGFVSLKRKIFQKQRKVHVYSMDDSTARRRINLCGALFILYCLDVVCEGYTVRFLRSSKAASAEIPANRAISRTGELSPVEGSSGSPG